MWIWQVNNARQMVDRPEGEGGYGGDGGGGGGGGGGGEGAME